MFKFLLPYVNLVILVRARGLRKAFKVGLRKNKNLYAVDGVDLEIKVGERVCLIGESGCGKTTLAKLLLALIKPTRGKVFFKDVEISNLGVKKLREIRKEMQFIPQHPESALDPRWTIYDSIAEPLRIHKVIDNKKEERERVLAMVELLGLKPEHLGRKPLDLSGGELQRAIIARALILEPKFIVADEPTSMLDASTQAKILNLFTELHKKLGFSYLFITHDLGVAKFVGDSLLVMHAGRIVEAGKTEVLLRDPLHPYTSLLVFPEDQRYYESKALNEKNSCKFYSVCPSKRDVCSQKDPELFEVNKGRMVRCWLYGDQV